MKNRKYDIEIDGYRIRNNADLNRVDMSKSQRNRHNRKIKLKKRDWYKQLHQETMNQIEKEQQDYINQILELEE